MTAQEGTGPSDVVVRPAWIDDADIIAYVHVRAWQVAYRGHMPDHFLDKLDVRERAMAWRATLAKPGQYVLVSETAPGRIGGFVSLVASRDADAAPLTGEIAAIYVDPDQVRRGVGSALISAALARSRELGFRCVTLWVLSANTPARAFYEHCGFVVEGKNRKDDRWSDFTLHEVRYKLG
jgi:L-amino acid N-acyltransferase YncA